MKYIAPLNHDDQNTLILISQNARVSSYPGLQERLTDVLNGYTQYAEARGDAWRIQRPLTTLSQELAASLRTHYATQPNDLTVINDIRDKVSPLVCPMCGSSKPSQVDHVAPKEIYPEYSFFTRNLVPACDCNGFKKLTFKGTVPGERVLHPYYDVILREPLVYIEFSGDLDAPDVEIKIFSAYVDDLAVNFHVDEILKKTRVLEWVTAKWAAIRRIPEDVFPLLKFTPGVVDGLVVRTAIRMHATAKNSELGTPNNWDSMVYEGILLSEDVIRYIVERINGLRNGQIIPD